MLAHKTYANEKKSAGLGLIYLEADPLAYFNKGFSIHPGYENWGFRFDITLVHVDFPKSFETKMYGTDQFDLVTDIQGFKLDYIGDNTEGGFIGVDINRQRLDFTHEETKLSKRLYATYLGVRTGWKFILIDSLYVTPWLAIWKNISAKKSFAVQDSVVTVNPWDFLVTLHIGYHFDLTNIR